MSTIYTLKGSNPKYWTAPGISGVVTNQAQYPYHTPGGMWGIDTTEPIQQQISANQNVQPYEFSSGVWGAVNTPLNYAADVVAGIGTATQAYGPQNAQGQPTGNVSGYRPVNLGAFPNLNTPIGLNPATWFQKNTIASAIASMLNGFVGPTLLSPTLVSTPYSISYASNVNAGMPGPITGSTINPTNAAYQTALQSNISYSNGVAQGQTYPGASGVTIPAGDRYVPGMGIVSPTGTLVSGPSSLVGSVGSLTGATVNNQAVLTNVSPGGSTSQTYVEGTFINGVWTPGPFQVGINGEPIIPTTTTTTTSSTTSTVTTPITTTTETSGPPPPTSTTSFTPTTISTTATGSTTSTAITGTATSAFTSQTLSTATLPQAVTTLYNSLGPSITTNPVFQSVVGAVGSFLGSASDTVQRLFAGLPTTNTGTWASASTSIPKAPITPEQIALTSQTVASTHVEPIVTGSTGTNTGNFAKQSQFIIKEVWMNNPQIAAQFSTMPQVLADLYNPTLLALGIATQTANLATESYSNLAGLESVIGTPLQPSIQVISNIMNTAIGLNTVSPTTIANISAALQSIGIDPTSALGKAAIAAGAVIGGVSAKLAAHISLAKVNNPIGSTPAIDPSTGLRTGAVTSTGGKGGSVSSGGGVSGGGHESGPGGGALGGGRGRGGY